jgi:hypothetical protein
MTESATSPASPPATRGGRRSRWKIVLTVLALLALVLGALWWWHNRAIKPVTLSSDEKVVLDGKLQAIGPDPGSQRDTGELSAGELDPGPAYEKGKKEFEITERELNGLLNEHTKLGESLRFELVPGAVHARIATDLDPDLPIVGGKRLKARARFLIETRDGVPELVLDDLTVWGISVPNDWLGGLKGQNLLGEVLGKGPQLSGIEKFEVERGRLLIKLKE